MLSEEAVAWKLKMAAAASNRRYKVTFSAKKFSEISRAKFYQDSELSYLL